MEIWIASHIDVQQRYTFLLDSLKRLESLESYKIRLSISSELKELKLPETKGNLFVYYHDKRMKQFQHIKFLMELPETKDNTKVIFLDDDDILFPEFLSSDVLKNNDCGYGLQCKNLSFKLQKDLYSLQEVKPYFDSFEECLFDKRYIPDIKQDLKERNIIVPDDQLIFYDYTHSDIIKNAEISIKDTLQKMEKHVSHYGISDTGSFSKDIENIKQELKEITGGIYSDTNPNARKDTTVYYKIKYEFSGSWCTIKILKDFMKTLTEITPLTDMKFKSYMANNGKFILKEPNVFGRNWQYLNYWAYDPIKSVPLK